MLIYIDFVGGPLKKCHNQFGQGGPPLIWTMYKRKGGFSAMSSLPKRFDNKLFEKCDMKRKMCNFTYFCPREGVVYCT